MNAKQEDQCVPGSHAHFAASNHSNRPLDLPCHPGDAYPSQRIQQFAHTQLQSLPLSQQAGTEAITWRSAVPQASLPYAHAVNGAARPNFTTSVTHIPSYTMEFHHPAVRNVICFPIMPNPQQHVFVQGGNAGVFGAPMTPMQMCTQQGNSVFFGAASLQPSSVDFHGFGWNNAVNYGTNHGVNSGNGMIPEPPKSSFSGLGNDRILPNARQQERVASDSDCRLETPARQQHTSAQQDSLARVHASATNLCKVKSHPLSKVSGKGVQRPNHKKCSTKSLAKNQPSGYGALATRLKHKLHKKPKRPLTAYNIFFKDERAAILKENAELEQRERDSIGMNDELESDSERLDMQTSTFPGNANAPYSVGETTTDEIRRQRRKRPHGKIGFQQMAKTIGERWKMVDPARRVECERRSKEDFKRYRADLAVYNEQRLEALRATQKELESSVPQETKERYFERLSSASEPAMEPTSAESSTKADHQEI